MLKLSKTIEMIDEGVNELIEVVSKEFSFLDGYEKIDHMPEPESIEIFTVYGTGLSSLGNTTVVSDIEELIPTHLASIGEQLLKDKKVYVRVKTELTRCGIGEIGLYTRLILI